MKISSEKVTLQGVALERTFPESSGPCELWRRYFLSHRDHVMSFMCSLHLVVGAVPNHRASYVTAVGPSFVIQKLHIHGSLKPSFQTETAQVGRRGGLLQPRTYRHLCNLIIGSSHT